MRLTQHNSRGRRDGTVYDPRHNDRDFDTDKAKHIQTGPFLQSNGQTYWACYPGMSFAETERRYYGEHFCNALTAQNNRYRTSGHPERCKTMDQYRTSPRTCPEAQILQIGKAGELDPIIGPHILRDIVQAQLDWEQAQYPQCVILDWALHVDEPEAAPHVHVRRVWIGHDKDGQECVSQTKALAEMGVERPDPGKAKSRYNNAKQTYTQECRAHFVQLCRERGLDIVTVPLEASEVGLSHTEYKRRQEEHKAQQALKTASEALKQASETIAQAQEIRDEIPDFEGHIQLLRDRDQLDQIRDDHPELFDDKGKYNDRHKRPGDRGGRAR